MFVYVTPNHHLWHFIEHMQGERHGERGCTHLGLAAPTGRQLGPYIRRQRYQQVAGVDEAVARR